VGEQRTILHTTDGGATWAAQNSGMTGYLLGISSTDANTCTAVGGGTFCDENNCYDFQTILHDRHAIGPKVFRLCAGIR
jgi:photosystem II stability/assembly factor-like uncharacterized protein